MKKMVLLVLFSTTCSPMQRLEAFSYGTQTFALTSMCILMAAIEAEWRRISRTPLPDTELREHTPQETEDAPISSRTQLLKDAYRSIYFNGPRKTLKKYPYLFGGTSVALLSAAAAAYQANARKNTETLSTADQENRTTLNQHVDIQTVEIAPLKKALPAQQEPPAIHQPEHVSNDQQASTSSAVSLDALDTKNAPELVVPTPPTSTPATDLVLPKTEPIVLEENSVTEEPDLNMNHNAFVEIPSTSLIPDPSDEQPEPTTPAPQIQPRLRPLPQAPNPLGINFSEKIDVQSLEEFNKTVRDRRNHIQQLSSAAGAEAERLNDACTVATTELDLHPVYTKYNEQHEAARHTAWIAACEAAYTHHTHTQRARNFVSKNNLLATAAIDAVYDFAQKNPGLNPDAFYQQAIQHARKVTSRLKGQIQREAAQVTMAEETAHAAVESLIATMPALPGTRPELATYVRNAQLESAYAATFSTIMKPENSVVLLQSSCPLEAQSRIISEAMDAGAMAIHDYSGQALESLNTTLQSLAVPKQPLLHQNSRMNMLAAIKQGAFDLKKAIPKVAPETPASELAAAIETGRAGLRKVTTTPVEKTAQRTIFDDMVDRVQAGQSIEASVLGKTISPLAQSILASQTITEADLAKPSAGVALPAQEIVRQATEQEQILIPSFLRGLLGRIRAEIIKLPALQEEKYGNTGGKKYRMNDEVTSVIRGIVVLSVRRIYNERPSEEYIRTKVRATIEYILHDKEVQENMKHYNPTALDKSTTVDPIKKAIAQAYERVLNMTDEQLNQANADLIRDNAELNLEPLGSYEESSFSTPSQTQPSTTDTKELQQGYQNLIERFSVIRRAKDLGGESPDDDDWDE